MAHHPVHHRGSQAYELNPMLFDELERLSFIEAFHEVHGLPEEQSDVRGIAVQVVKRGPGISCFDQGVCPVIAVQADRSISQ